jgi:hypothetical protein
MANEGRARRVTVYSTSSKTIPARAREIGLGVSTLYGEIREGRGPRITCLSPRRRIITDQDWAEWCATRRDNPPEAVTAQASGPHQAHVGGRPRNPLKHEARRATTPGGPFLF